MSIRHFISSLFQAQLSTREEDIVKRTLIVAAVAAICASAFVPIEANAFVRVDPAAGAAGAPSLAIERAGCYRLGETGYHWYSFCLGPRWLYPHHHHHYY
jgi:hypothetical protein